MKKFYESPIVELTVFDVEDVITASGTVDTINDTEDVQALINAISAGTYSGAQIDRTATYTNGAYNW